MDYSVDVIGEFKKVKKRFLILSLIFSFALALVLTTDVLLVVLTKDNYIVSLIIAAVISVLFTWFAIFFFTNIYNEVNARYRYFRGFDSGVKETDEVEFIAKGEGLCYVNGLYVYPIYVKYFNGMFTRDKEIYSLSNELDYKLGDKLTITTYQRVIIKAEKHS